MSDRSSAEALRVERETEMVRLIQARDENGLRLLLEDTAPRISWWLSHEFRGRLTPTDVDEALIDGAFAAWRSITTFDPARGTLRAWFYVICRNEALKTLRRARRQGPVVHLSDWQAVPAPSQEADDETPDAEHARFLADFRDCIARLPRLQKAVIEADLATDGVADAAELAASLGTTRNTIYNSRSTARKTICRALRELGYHADTSGARETEGESG
jgi:RNA polymerase sigma factor (sigma-70 family)